MQEFDLIVVGAGPGGSNAAGVALRNGLRVAQIDRRPFPRVKPCAGGLTVKACRSLALELSPTVREVSTAFEFNLWLNRETRFWHRGPVIRMVHRPDFDNALVEQNTRQPGFSFFDGEAVDAIAHDGRFVVTTSRRTMAARQLIAADGAYSTVNRIFGIAKPKAFALAVEVNLAHARRRDDVVRVPCFDFGAIEHGYGWVFPKDDHSSVGLYTLARGLPQMRARLLEYIRARGFDVSGDPLDTFQGHQIPIGGHRLRVPDVPVYVVGDAGGFADALTGEGIYHALESGRLAGETAVDVARGRATHRRYYRRLWGSVLPDTWLTYRLSRLFYKDVGRALRVIERPFVWRALVQGSAEGATFTGSLLRGAYFYARSFAGGGAVSAGRNEISARVR
jgi:menaquinone-9 beta-reductase